MLEFFDGGRRWTRGKLWSAGGQQRCLIGALRHIRHELHTRGADAEPYLRAALLSTLNPLFDLAIARLCGERGPRNRGLTTYNDGCDAYDEVQALILKARDLAQAKLRRERTASAASPPLGASGRSPTKRLWIAQAASPSSRKTPCIATRMAW
jgi:hypothetical protein